MTLLILALCGIAGLIIGHKIACLFRLDKPSYRARRRMAVSRTRVIHL